MSHIYLPVPTANVRAMQSGGPDDYGNPPEHHISDGNAYPCRHCLSAVPKGEPYLIVAMKPFLGQHAYTETGPVFLCARPCEAATPAHETPAILDSPDYILRGYDSGERIVYGTGEVTRVEDFDAKITAVFDDPSVAFIHVRSARNNCYQCRIERAE